MNKSKGFTIIELIVVIAIIAILAAIVMDNVTQYINKSKDASIKQLLESANVMSTQYIEEHGDYAGFCGYWWSIESPALNKLTPGASMANCQGTSTEWALCAILYEGSDSAWCLDNTGVKMVIPWTTSCNGGIGSNITNCKDSLGE